MNPPLPSSPVPSPTQSPTGSPVNFSSAPPRAPSPPQVVTDSSMFSVEDAQNAVPYALPQKSSVSPTNPHELETVIQMGRTSPAELMALHQDEIEQQNAAMAAKMEEIKRDAEIKVKEAKRQAEIE